MPPFTFPAGYSPIEPIQTSTKPVLRGARFGKGPESTKTVGLNQFLPSFNVAWPPLTTIKLNVVTQFLEARQRGNDWFWWSHPKKGNIKVRCRRFTQEPAGNELYELLATFDQTVEP